MHRAASDVAYTGFRQQLLDVGLEVTDGAEHVGRYTFLNMAALVAYLQRVPWETPEDFSVDGYADQLLAWHRDSPGPLSLTRKRFWLGATRPGP